MSCVSVSKETPRAALNKQEMKLSLILNVIDPKAVLRVFFWAGGNFWSGGVNSVDVSKLENAPVLMAVEKGDVFELFCFEE